MMNKMTGIYLSLVSALFVMPVVAEDVQQAAVADETPAQVETTEAVSNEVSSNEAPSNNVSHAASGKVSRAQFTTEVVDREPTDRISDVPDIISRLYFFTELTGMQGQVVKHRWEYKGQVMAEVNFDVRGPRWRVWSTKDMLPEWQGMWTVKVVNGAGEVVVSEDLNYGG